MRGQTNSCFEMCPHRAAPDFSDFEQRCEGFRVRLDDYKVATQHGLATGELALKACGAKPGPDTDLSTISAQDYADTTLTIPELKELYDQGLLPEQAL